MSRVSLEQVADAAGVSVRTVSNAIRGTEKGVRSDAAARAARIRAIAQEMGYRSNVAARAMKTGRHNAFGLLLSEQANISGIPWLLQWNIQQCMGEHDLHMVMAHVRHANLSSHTGLPRILREWAVDGLIMSYRAEPPLALQQVIEGLQLPTVWINNKGETDCIRPDDLQAGLLATEEILKLGHQRVLYLTSSRPADEAHLEHFSVADREAGYRQAMEAAGLTPSVKTVPWGWEKPGDVHAYFTELLNKPDRPTAIVTYVNGTSHYSLIEAARDAGLSMPGDLAIIGFEQEWQDLGRVQMAQCRHPHREVGRGAVEMLLQKMENGNRPLPEQVYPYTLLPGNTLTPPAAS